MNSHKVLLIFSNDVWMGVYFGVALLCLPIKINPFDLKRLPGILKKFLRKGHLEIALLKRDFLLRLL